MFWSKDKEKFDYDVHDYEYDDENRLVWERYGGMTVYYTHHDIYRNNVILIERINIPHNLRTFWADKVTILYDDRGNKIREYDTLGRDIEYYYDDNNRLTRKRTRTRKV